LDTLDLIREKADRIRHRGQGSGVYAVIRHIELAERHFEQGRAIPDPELFIDVIARTNRAFEGMLTEAYTVLTGKSPAGKRTADMEKYLEDHRVFEKRVTELFAQYRTKWRNPSTHDHAATFSESEAFLCVLNVTAFVGILMDQILGKLAFDDEQRKAREDAEVLREAMQRNADEPLMDRLAALLQTFAHHAKIGATDQHETELVASLLAFMTETLPTAKARVGVEIEDQFGTVRPDLIVEEGDERAIIELRRYHRWGDKVERGEVQKVERYMNAAGAKLGFVVAVPAPGAEVGSEQHDKVIARNLDGGRVLVTIRLLPRT
jgi:hypothetical protein